MRLFGRCGPPLQGKCPLAPRSALTTDQRQNCLKKNTVRNCPLERCLRRAVGFTRQRSERLLTPISTHSRRRQMFLHRARLFSLAGFTVWVDVSWLIFAVILVWSLAIGIFPSITPSLPAATYWWMAV